MKAFLKAFVYAGQGIWKTIRTQRNFRFHIVAAVYVTAFSFFYELSRAEYVLLVLTFSSVMASEMINTAIEAAVDLFSPEYNKIAKNAKDAAAGAVLVTAVFAVIVAVILFLDFDVIGQIIKYYSENIPQLMGLIASVPIAIAFVAKFGTQTERNKHGDKK